MNTSTPRDTSRSIKLALLLITSASPVYAQADAQASRARLDELRLVGKAHYENDKYEEAAEKYRECIRVAPESASDRFNLGLVLMRAQAHEEALRVLDEAADLDPDLLGVHYLRGIICKRELDFDKAIANLTHVIEHDPECFGAYYNIAVCYRSTRAFDKAVQTLLQAIELQPDHPSAHFLLIATYRSLGEVDNAERHLEIYNRIKDTIDESEKTIEALERSRYAYILDVPAIGKDVTPARTPAFRLVDATREAGIESPGWKPGAPPGDVPPADYDAASFIEGYLPTAGGAVALGDVDNDGDLDLYVVNCASSGALSCNRLLVNDGTGRFEDGTVPAGVCDSGYGVHAVFGDYDNDGHLDLYVVNEGPNVLYHNQGDGTFEDVSAQASVDEPHFGRRAAMFDYDHDNDLDLIIANDLDFEDFNRDSPVTAPNSFFGQVNALLRNNGNGTFSDQTDEAGLLIEIAQTRDLIYADYDGDADTDVLLVNYDQPSRLFLNQRLGQFKPGGGLVPALDKGARAAAHGDFNRDGHLDLIIARDNELLLYTNDGGASFSGRTIDLPEVLARTGVGRIVIGDFDNDGWSDLILTAGDGGRLVYLAGDGPNRFRDLTGVVGPNSMISEIADVVAGDLDQDGDMDLVVMSRDRGPVILRNDREHKRRWLTVVPVGKKNNRSARGATVEIAVSGHYQKQVVSESGFCHFGLGELDHVDIVRVTWPNGIAQNVIQPEINRTLTVEEYVKVSVSCAFLWADDGSGFKLINEILGIGPLGAPMAPGQYYPPDCTELTLIEPGQLVAKDGRYELRLTEDLREICFADQIRLRVIDHPSSLEIVPNEYFTLPPFPEDRFFAVADRIPPRSAFDDRGHDVLDLVTRRDGRYPTFPTVPRHWGVADPHHLTLDFGQVPATETLLLCLDGWIYWPEASTTMALAQDPGRSPAPLSLQVPDENGEWHTVIESVGLPTSKGIVVPVDMSGKFLCGDHRIRLSTSLCVYFDRVFLATRDHADRCRVNELPVSEADLYFRGFSRLMRDEHGYEDFDYDDVSPTGSWNPPTGMFTRYGDVTRLLAEPDDQYVIFGPGDEITMFFDATGLPDLPEGWSRSFIFYANGWVKDGDLNTKFSATVEPLPFHGMSHYPYRDDEHYPDSPAHQQYQRTYNTRPGRSTVGDLTGGLH